MTAVTILMNNGTAIRLKCIRQLVLYMNLNVTFSHFQHSVENDLNVTDNMS